jgi:gliding motility-associated-like protein
MDSVKYYWDTISTYNPYSAQGSFLKSAKINTTLGNVTACPSCTTSCSQCPTIQSIFVNSCNGSGAEQDNEFIIIHSGSGFNAANFQLTYNSTNSIGAANLGINVSGSSCSLQTPTAALMDSIRSSTGCDTNKTKVVTPSMTIPPNSYVILFCSSNVTKKYDFSNICASGLVLYVMQSSCQRTSGAFTNGASSTTPPQTTILGLSNCSSCIDTFKYSRAGLSNTDGEYALRHPSGIATKANGGVAINSLNPCNGPLAAFHTVDTVKFVVNQTTMCGRDTLYLKGVFRNHPNTGVCPNTASIATSNTVKLVVMCPNAQITAPSYFCHGDTILAKATNTNPRPNANNTYVWSNSSTIDSTKIYQSGTYTVTLNENGCLDTHSFTTKKADSSISATNTSLDSCQSVRYKGVTYTSNALAFDTLKTKNGLCDSIIYQQPILILKNDTVTTKACYKAGFPYTFRGTNYSAQGNYYVDSSTTRKCFRVFHLDLSVSLINRDTQRIYTCQPNYTISGVTYTANATHRDTIKNTLGCDSFIHEYPITFIPKITRPTVTIPACISYTFKARIYTSPTTVFDTIRSILAPTCDSIITPTFLEIFSAPTRINRPMIDSCKSVRIGGKTYTSSTTHFDTVKKQNGLCDSIIYQTPIVILQNDTTRISGCINQGQSYIFFGNPINVVGIYFHSIPKSKGCDSIIRLDLSRGNPNTIVRDTAACDSFTYKSRIYKSNTTILDTFRNVLGCDSTIRRLRLTLYSPIIGKSDTLRACAEVFFRGQRITTNTSFDSVFKKRVIPFCDSVQKKFVIVIYPLPTGIIGVTPDTIVPAGNQVQLTATGGVSYSWLIDNSTANPLTYTMQERTYFEVRIRDKNNCERTIGKWVDVVAEIEINEAFSPNGDGINDIIAPTYKGNVVILFFKIYNRWGQTIYEGSGADAKWDGRFNGTDQPQGSYVYSIQYNINGKTVTKTGGLTLIK